MSQKQIIKKFKTKTGKKAVLRLPRSADAADLMRMINSVIDENDYITTDKKMTLKQEKEFVKKIISQFRKKEAVHLVVQIEEKVVGIAGVTKNSNRISHIGLFGITLMKNYRDEGVGKKLMYETLKLAKKLLKLKIVKLDVLKTNTRAIVLYKKMGFKKYGMLPRAIRFGNKYVDEIKMFKEI